MIYVSTECNTACLPRRAHHGQLLHRNQPHPIFMMFTWRRQSTALARLWPGQLHRRQQLNSRRSLTRWMALALGLNVPRCFSSPWQARPLSLTVSSLTFCSRFSLQFATPKSNSFVIKCPSQGARRQLTTYEYPYWITLYDTQPIEQTNHIL